MRWRLRLSTSRRANTNTHWEFFSNWQFGWKKNTKCQLNLIMNTKNAETWLAMLYIGSVLLSVISIVSLVTAWQHWAWTLDTCIEFDCGCILYGINTFNTFIGGDVKLCHFASYCPVPGILIGLCLGGYHGYRCCIHKDLDKPKRINRGRVYRDDRYLCEYSSYR